MARTESGTCFHGPRDRPRVFFGPDRSQGAESLILMLLLKQYIRHILCVTCQGPAKHSKMLLDSLCKFDSILTFNYDLLIDTILLNDRDKANHYANFHQELLGRPLAADYEGRDRDKGRDRDNKRIYLKLHGSLNWLQCTNRICRMANTIVVEGSGEKDIDLDALARVCTTPYGRDWHNCRACHSAMTPLLIPPLLHKQIMDNGVIRSVWGHAFNRLASAARIVIIGFSFPATDFYAEWLFRNAARVNPGANVWILDPKNTDQDFQKRLQSIFRGNCRFDFKKFDEIGDLLRKLDRT